MNGTKRVLFSLSTVFGLTGLLVAQAVAHAQAPTCDSSAMVDERELMVVTQLERRDITDPLVLEAMRKVPRHCYVPEELVGEAYDDNPLPIGHRQTISQPYIVAFMTQTAGIEQGERCLEIGTGSGYQAAILGEICGEVYSIEIVEPLGELAQERLDAYGYDNIHVRIGDGYRGWPDEAPFDAIVVTAAPDHIPQPLIDQLGEGGLLIIPVGSSYQELILVERKDGEVTQRSVLPVRFVPMTGEAQEVEEGGLEREEKEKEEVE